jgi:hypothetical protein
MNFTKFFLKNKNVSPLLSLRRSTFIDNNDLFFTLTVSFFYHLGRETWRVKYAKRGLGTIQKEIEVGLFALNGQVSFLFLYNNNLHDIFLFSLIFFKKKKEKENYREKMKIPPYSPSLRYALNLSTSKATLKGVCLCICVCLPCLLSLELLREYRV